MRLRSWRLLGGGMGAHRKQRRTHQQDECTEADLVRLLQQYILSRPPFAVTAPQRALNAGCLRMR
jgi:hypothetical protein